MNTFTLTFTVQTEMSQDELEQWASELRDDASAHLIGDETIQVKSIEESN